MQYDGVKSLKPWTIPSAAAVLVFAAVALPSVLIDTDSDSELDTATGTSRSGRPLALDAMPIGAEPQGGYLVGTEFHKGADRVSFTLERGSSVTELVAMSDGYLLSMPDALGEQRVQFVGRDGTHSRTWDVEEATFFSTLAVSDDGGLGAFVRAGGKPVVVQDGGRTVTELPRPGEGLDTGLAPVAVTGTDCAGADADCAVLVHGLDHTGGVDSEATTWTVRPGQPAATERNGIGDIRTVAANGFAAGTVRIIEDGDGACAGVADTRGTVLWTTCKDRLLSFSPDSELVLATTSALYGSGDHELTVFDARTGEEKLRLETARKVGIYEMTWEDDDHVLAVISDWTEDDSGSDDRKDLRWAVVRISLDGTREYAVTPVPGNVKDFDGPLDLPKG